MLICRLWAFTKTVIHLHFSRFVGQRTHTFDKTNHLLKRSKNGSSRSSIFATLTGYEVVVLLSPSTELNTLKMSVSNCFSRFQQLIIQLSLFQDYCRIYFSVPIKIRCFSSLLSLQTSLGSFLSLEHFQILCWVAPNSLKWVFIQSNGFVSSTGMSVFDLKITVLKCWNHPRHVRSLTTTSLIVIANSKKLSFWILFTTFT